MIKMKNLCVFLTVQLILALLCVYGASGISTSNSRVIGGVQVANITQAKHQVGIFSAANGSLVCGGVLVKPNIVLTLVNCLNNINDVYVIAGTRDWQNDMNFQKLSASKIVFHSSFVNPVENNIALIKLTDDFQLNDRVGVVPIASSIPNNPICNTTGWGFTTVNGQISPLLMSVNVSMINKTFCASSLPSGTYWNLDTVICTRTEGNYYFGPCPGDFGGALICNGQFVGISFYGNCADYRNLPALYTEVRHFQKWIDENSSSRAFSGFLVSIFLPLMASLLNNERQ